MQTDMGKNIWCYGLLCARVGHSMDIWLDFLRFLSVWKCNGHISRLFSAETGRKNIFRPNRCGKCFSVFFRGSGAEKVERFRRLWHGKCFFRRRWCGKCFFRIFSAETGRKIVVFSAIIPHTIQMLRNDSNPQKCKYQCHNYNLQPESGIKHAIQGSTGLYLHMVNHVGVRSTHTDKVTYHETYLISCDWD